MSTALDCGDRKAVLRSPKDLYEDLELSILMERLRLLSTQRQLATLRCQNFTDMLEAEVAEDAAVRADELHTLRSADQRTPHHHRRRRRRATSLPRASLENQHLPPAYRSNSVPSECLFGEAALYYS
jgi:hypothetical protein